MLPAQILSFLDNLKNKECSVQVNNHSFMLKATLIDYYILENELFIRINSPEFLPDLMNNDQLMIKFDKDRVKFRSSLHFVRETSPKELFLICSLPTVLFNGAVYVRSHLRIHSTNAEITYQNIQYSVKDVSEDGIGVNGVLPCFINEKIEFTLKDKESGLEVTKLGTIIHYTNDCTGIRYVRD